MRWLGGRLAVLLWENRCFHDVLRVSVEPDSCGGGGGDGDVVVVVVVVVRVVVVGKVGGGRETGEGESHRSNNLDNGLIKISHMGT